jgi:hypothetical protein
MTEAQWLECDDPEPMIRFLLGAPVSETVHLHDLRAVELHWFPQCRGSDRQRRLFLCACCRAVDPALTGAAFRTALEVTERYFGGSATADEVAVASTVLTAEVDAFLVEHGYLSATPPVPAPRRGWFGFFARVGRWVSGSPANASGRAEDWSAERFRRFALDRLAQAASDLGYDHSAASGIDWVITEGVRLNLIDWGPRGWYGRIPALCREVFGNLFESVNFDPAWHADTAVSLAQQMYDARDFSAMPILADALQDAGCDNEGILSHCRSSGPHVRGCWVVDLVLGKE